MRSISRVVWVATMLLVIWVATFYPAPDGRVSNTVAISSQTIGILPFQDASGSDYGGSLAPILAKQLQAALLNASQMIPRFLKFNEEAEVPEQFDLDNALKLARSQKVDFAVWGTLLTAQVEESEGGISTPVIGGITAGGQSRSQAAEVVLQVELLDVGRGERIASLRATGKERNTKISADVYSDYGSMDMGGAVFQSTVLGKATQKAVGEAVKQMLPQIKPASAAASGKSPVAARPASGETASSMNVTSSFQGMDSQAAGNSAAAGTEVYGNRFDFVPGDKVLVYDDFSETSVGEYPAKWTTKGGGGNTAEVVQRDDRKFFQSRYSKDGADASMNWLRYDIQGDMPRNFTIELDADVGGYFSLVFGDPAETGSEVVTFEPERVRSRSAENNVNLGSGVKHISVSVSGTSVKAYVEGERVINDPDALDRPIRRIGFRFESTSGDPNPGQMFTAFRLAEGGKDFKTMLAGTGRIITHGILFDTGSDKLKPESGPTLRSVLQLLEQDPKLRFTIEGHTDNQGGATINGPLSKRRAEAVKAWLLKQGIDASRLASTGLGDTKPIDTNSTAEGRANNRRVEFVKSSS